MQCVNFYRNPVQITMGGVCLSNDHGSVLQAKIGVPLTEQTVPYFPRPGQHHQTRAGKEPKVEARHHWAVFHMPRADVVVSQGQKEPRHIKESRDETILDRR